MSIYSFFLDYHFNANWLAVIRILSCSCLLAYFTMILKDAWEFSKPNGIFTGDNYIIYNQRFPQISIFNFYPNSAVVHLLTFILLYVSGLFSIIGLFTNFSLLIFMVCVISLQSRLKLILYTAGDAIVRTMLLCLLLTDCGAALSLDVLFKINNGSELVNGWPIRLFQIFICIVYFGSAIPKLHDEFWLNGTVVRNATMSGTWGKRIFRKLFTKYTRSMSIVSLIYEYLAPLLLMVKETSLITVIFGIIFHMGITIFMRVGYFGPIMCISLLFFINPSNFQFVKNLFNIIF
jgi:hypothetical protein